MENKSSSPLTSTSSFAEIINIITHLSTNVPYFGFSQCIPANLYLDFFFLTDRTWARFLVSPLPFTLFFSVRAM